ncbi:hypothetical protein PP175_29095 (plasmid) [Aneurinibacillus sp. Ricciae_BoGa-3]|uniref:hypothetical protein n=1 Tax=Aneurinibacillus sp. Ricciae_BoGa-3 TaxID=3022697 RepID=UPI0023408DCE|nr:hypothetical protein [Aneurinibacillus sp. Ricciae_BoGa-3]WCK57249.1 hypothetical protein PP175_29095 [Aneurinibacillus sp. Ricciae_BoGa-3]
MKNPFENEVPNRCRWRAINRGRNKRLKLTKPLKFAVTTKQRDILHQKALKFRKEVKHRMIQRRESKGE